MAAMAEAFAGSTESLLEDRLNGVLTAQVASSHWLQVTGCELISFVEFHAARKLFGHVRCCCLSVRQEDAAAWVELVDPEGNAYYHNGSTGDSRWQEPPEHLHFLNELDGALQLMEVRQSSPAHCPLASLPLPILCALSPTTRLGVGQRPRGHRP